MDPIVYACAAMLLVGPITWLIAARLARQWLKINDPTFIPLGRRERFFIGGLLTSFGPMSRYTELRRAHGEPTGAATAFWIGFTVSILGVALVIFRVIRAPL